MAEENTETKILKILLKQFSSNHTITSLANELEISRVGLWKSLKKLESKDLIVLAPIGKGKTSVIRIKLDWQNIVLEKKLSLILTEEASTQRRWVSNFEEIKILTEFAILYGSILHSHKEANDIDILCLSKNKNNFLEIEKRIQRIQKTQAKKIHAESFIKTELKNELKKPNKIFIDAIKKGVIIFGQESFVNFIKEMQK